MNPFNHASVPSGRLELRAADGSTALIVTLLLALCANAGLAHAASDTSAPPQASKDESEPWSLERIRGLATLYENPENPVL